MTPSTKDTSDWEIRGWLPASPEEESVWSWPRLIVIIYLFSFSFFQTVYSRPDNSVTFPAYDPRSHAAEAERDAARR